MLQRILRVAMASLMGVMTIVVFLQVVVRYFTDTAIPWAQELSRFTMVWMVFLGAIAAAVNNEHIEVDALVRRFRGRTRLVMDGIRYFFILVFCGLVVVGSRQILELTFKQLSPTLGWKMGWIYLAIPFSLGTILLITLFEAIRTFKDAGKHEGGL